MKERPILFSAPMVRAILEGRKTQTRRKIAIPPSTGAFVCADWGNGFWPYVSSDGESLLNNDGNEQPISCPYGKPGDRLWVREGCAVDSERVFYRLDHEEAKSRGPRVDVRWRPSIHMPRWASRITLEITDVRVQRLQEISEEDAASEGISTSVVNPSPRGVAPIYPKQYGSNIDVFHDLWEQINGAGSWDANPWVWSVSFKPIQGEDKQNG